MTKRSHCVRMVLLLLAVSVAVLAPGASSGLVLYGATGGGDFIGVLWEIDPATGAAQEIGSIGFYGVTGLAILPDGRLVASANTAADPGNSILIEIDRTTGAGTLIGVIGDFSGGGCARMPDLTYDFSRGRLLGYGDYCDSDPEGLHIIDPVTGQGTPIGSSGYNGGGNGLAWEPATDTLYGTPFDNSSLVIFDPVSGVGSDVPGSAGNVPYRVNALAFHPVTGVLYGSCNRGSGNADLVIISTVDGETSTVGATAGRLDALVFDPEAQEVEAIPVTGRVGLLLLLGLLVAGGVFLLRRL